MDDTHEGLPSKNVETNYFSPIEQETSMKAASDRAVDIRRLPRIEEVVTEYFNEHPPHSSKWFAEQARLFDRYLLPRFGERWLSGVQTEEWFEMIEAAALERQADGISLHKSLKTFNNYTIRRKLRKVNPLAKTTPDSLSIRHFDICRP